MPQHPAAYLRFGGVAMPGRKRAEKLAKYWRLDNLESAEVMLDLGASELERLRDNIPADSPVADYVNRLLAEMLAGLALSEKLAELRKVLCEGGLVDAPVESPYVTE